MPVQASVLEFLHLVMLIIDDYIIVTMRWRTSIKILLLLINNDWLMLLLYTGGRRSDLKVKSLKKKPRQLQGWPVFEM